MVDEAGTRPGDGEAASGRFEFRPAIVEMVQRGASDLHLKGGRPPTVRVNGQLSVLPQPALKPEELKELAELLMTPRQLKDFAERKEAERKEKVFKAVMFGFMAGSAVFLGERYLLTLDVETSVIAATFCAVALSVFLLKRIASA